MKRRKVEGPVAMVRTVKLVRSGEECRSDVAKPMIRRFRGAGRVSGLVPLFEPAVEAVLACQKRTVLRRADEIS